ncbi:IS3 family transposase [Desulfitobacterium sp. Sab5]|uniref:IS3 family transposase n=1 Tax=Desulfitobacterium nosdiversum TaxID=3375356 RepID=UPI003CF5720F
MDCSGRVEQQYNGIHLAKCTTYEELCIEVNDYMDYYNKERYSMGTGKACS